MSKCLLSYEMLCHAMVSDKPGGLSVCNHPPPPQENWPPSKILVPFKVFSRLKQKEIRRPKKIQDISVTKQLT